MCKCTDPKTGGIKEVLSRTKEMVYRIQAPNFQDAINKDKNKTIINKFEKSFGKGKDK